MKSKVTKYDILKLYRNNYNRRIYLREMARELKKPHQTIKPYLSQLITENVLIKHKRGKIDEYILDIKNEVVPEYLAIAEKEVLIHSLKNASLLRLIFENLAEYFNKDNTFIIFGSFIDKKEKAEDIDLLHIGNEKVKNKIKEISNTYNLNIHLINIEKIKDISNSLLLEIYKKHIILNNSDSCIRRLRNKYGKDILV